MTQIGALSVAIGADTTGLQRGLSQATGKVQNFRRAAMPAIKAIAAVGTAATAAAGAVLAFGRAGMNAIDAQAKLARQLDGTIGGLRGLQLAAEDAGVSTGTMNGALERFSARLGEAQRGTGQAAEALDRLGLSASELDRMDVDERMAAIADAVQELGLSGAQTADMLRQMGIRNRELVNLMRQGGDAIRDARSEIEDYGLAVDSVDAATIEAANDAFSRVGLVVESIRNALATELAPIILELADRFNTAAREAGGWGNVVREGVEFAIRGFGKVADAIHKVRIANAAVERGTAEMNLAFSQFAEWSWSAMSGLFDNIIDGINSVIDGFNRLPGVAIDAIGSFSESDFMGRIRDQTDQATQAAWKAREAYSSLAEQALPSENIEEFFNAIDERRQQLADSINEDGGFIPSGASGGNGGNGGAGGDGDSEGGQFSGLMLNEGWLELFRERLAERQAILDEFRTLEEELEIEMYEAKLSRLQEALDNELITQEEYYQAAQEAERSHWDSIMTTRDQALRNLSDMVGKSYGEQAGLAADALVQIVNATATHSKKAFEIQKAAAIASAIVSTYQGISKTLATYPWPIAGVMAAAHAATGFAQVAAIRSQSYNGGGSGGSMAGGTSSAGGSAPGGSTPSGDEAVRENTMVNINLTDEGMYSGRQVRSLIQSINDELDNGMRLRVN